VGGCIDPIGKPADYNQPARSKMAGEGLGVSKSAGGGISAADDGDCRAVEQIEVAFGEEPDGRIGDFAQADGISGVRDRDEPAVTGTLKPLDVSGDGVFVG
jgi:hypothetical protein